MTDAQPAADSRPPLTCVLLAYEHKRASRRLLFGEPVRRQTAGPGVSHAFFESDQAFCYVVWEAGSYGTKHWSLTVCRSARPDDTVAAVDGISPGAHVLLRAGTAHYVRKALAVTDAIVEAGTALTDVPNAYWRAVQVAFDGRKPAPFFSPSVLPNAAALPGTDR